MSLNSTKVETETEKEEKELNETTDYINKIENKNKILNEEKSLKTNIAKNYTDEKENNNIIISNTYNQNDDLQHCVGQFVIPNDLKKTLIMTLVLTILGICLIAVGLLRLIIGFGAINGNVILVLGCIVFVPGGYYSFQFLRAKLVKLEYVRKEILGSIPRL